MVQAKIQSLTHRTMAFYGLPHMTHSVVILPMVLFIPSFYADDLALPLASVGLAVAASRLLDVVTDPLVGILSDRLHTRWGRRKPWMALGTPLLVLSTWMVFVPGSESSIHYLLLWTCLLFLGFTLFDLPYKAWGAELSTDYHERSRVAAWRAGFGSAGHILFLAVIVVLTQTGHQENSSQLLVIALMVVIGMPILVAITLLKVHERQPEMLEGEMTTGWSGFKLIFRNRAFIRTLIALLLFGTGLMIQATLHKLVLTHVVGRPGLFSNMILLETIVAIAALPFWLRFSDHIGKHRALTLAGLWIGIWSLALPMVGDGDIELYMTLIILRGSSLGAVVFLSNSIAADVVDHDTVEAGRQRTGLYFSIWGMAIKMAVALGVLFATSLPAFYGFVPSEDIHSESSLSALMIIYGWVPFFIMITGFPFLWNFPIDREQHRTLRDQIEQRRSR